MKKIAIVPLAIFSLLFIFTFIVSFHTGFYSEDIHHLNSRTVEEAINLALQSYNYTNARIGELVLYFIGISSEGYGSETGIYFFRLFTPLFIISGSIFSFRLGTGRWPDNTKNNIVSLIALVLCILSNKTGYYWLCSNTNWLFPSVVTLFFIILIEPFFKSSFDLSWHRYIVIMLCTPIVGMSNENTSLTALLFLLAGGAFHMYKNKTFKTSAQYVSIVILLTAFCYLYYTAPGPHLRASSFNTEKLNLFEQSLKNCTTLVNWLHIIFWCWRLLLAWILVIIFCPISTWKTPRLLAIVSAIILMGGIITAAPNFGAPRSFIPIEFLIYALIAGFIYQALNQHTISKTKIIGLFIIQICMAVTILIPLVVNSIDSIRLHLFIQNKAKQALSNHEKHLILEASELEIPSIWNSKFRIPRTLMEFHRPMIPLIYTSETNIKPEELKHKYATFPYHPKNYQCSVSCGDDILNKGVAHMYGLESIVVIQPKKSP